MLPGTPTTGIKLGFMNSYNSVAAIGVAYENSASEIYAVTSTSSGYTLDAGTASAGWRAYFDSMTVNKVLRADTVKANMMELSSVSGLFNCLAPAQFSNVVIHKSGHKESIVDSAVTLLINDTNDGLYAEYSIGRDTPENVMVYLKVPDTGYTGGAWISAVTITKIELRLKIDAGITANLPLPGQVFNFTLKGIETLTGNLPIDTHPNVDIVLTANETVPGTPDFNWKNYGNNSAHTRFGNIVFVPKVSDVSVNSLDTYASSICLMYNYETLNPSSSVYDSLHLMYVKNQYTKE